MLCHGFYSSVRGFWYYEIICVVSNAFTPFFIILCSSVYDIANSPIIITLKQCLLCSDLDIDKANTNRKGRKKEERNERWKADKADCRRAREGGLRRVRGTSVYISDPSCRDGRVCQGIPPVLSLPPLGHSPAGAYSEHYDEYYGRVFAERDPMSKGRFSRSRFPLGSCLVCCSGARMCGSWWVQLLFGVNLWRFVIMIGMTWLENDNDTKDRTIAYCNGIYKPTEIRRKRNVYMMIDQRYQTYKTQHKSVFLVSKPSQSQLKIPSGSQWAARRGLPLVMAGFGRGGKVRPPKNTHMTEADEGSHGRGHTRATCWRPAHKPCQLTCQGP